MLQMRNYLKTGKSAKKSVMMVRLFIRSPTKLSDAFKMSEGDENPNNHSVAYTILR